ncbi:GNAT family N-acetyltransferase [Tropicimonas sp. TH_r6]|uniref:GNAT family N-acetyltransferase n=1 Tax=Tropicimonas sp. TH_r6 TaxID=3082085 RepID=UPI0029554236|nr:GNAT family N-acetyltransferase [Tropicimonas sp. TH_r6]MDV7141621.1 GNAT family N-acetyltransferase [Tropicimonas sp. TH_r6]
MTSSVPDIRRYRAEDNAALTEIWHRASAISHGFLGAQTLLAHRQLVSEIYLPRAETWVAWLDGDPVGFLGLLDDFIGGLFIAPERQGQGIGQALLCHGLTLKGRLCLDVYAANEGAVRFYLRMGFVETARRKQDKEGLPFEEISMCLAR